MDKIVGRAFMDIGGSITLKLEEEDGKQKEICFSCIRCGVSWPIDEYPGYYCALGLLNGAKVGDPGSLLFLCEGENELLEDLTEAVIQRAAALRLSEIFTDAQSPEWAGMSASAMKMIRSHKDRQNLRLRHAPFASDFHLGRDLIRRWGKNGALKIPEGSILHRHMVNPGPERAPEGLRYGLYPVSALRYVAMAFEKIQPLRHQESRSNVSPLGWS